MRSVHGGREQNYPYRSTASRKGNDSPVTVSSLPRFRWAVGGALTLPSAPCFPRQRCRWLMRSGQVGGISHVQDHVSAVRSNISQVRHVQPTARNILRIIRCMAHDSRAGRAETGLPASKRILLFILRAVDCIDVRSVTWKDITFINVPFPVRTVINQST